MTPRATPDPLRLRAVRDNGGMDTARVTVYTRPGCHLCETAVETIAGVCAEVGERWVEVDITTDPDLEDEYAEEIPVTFVDGRQHDFWRVDPDRLRAALVG